MAVEDKINVGGSAAIMGRDDGEGTQEFLKRTRYKSKIDQVIDFYGVPYCYKNNIDRFLQYGVQPRHYQICHDHFYQVMKATGYGVDDFSYERLQQEYDARKDKKGVGLQYKMDIANFKRQEEETKNVISADMMRTMQDMMEEIKQLKSKFLSNNSTNDAQTNTAGESETSETTESVGEIGIGEIGNSFHGGGGQTGGGGAGD